MSLVDEALSGPSVFKDEATLGFDYVPKELPHRDDELRTLGGWFRGVAEGTTSQFVTIQGPVGSGKTALARRFGEDLHNAMHKRGRELKLAYVNCRNDRTDAMAMTSIMRTLDPGFPDRGFAVPEMLDALAKRIRTKGVHLLVILDEVDVLLRDKADKEKSDLLYSFSRFDAGTGGPALSVIAVSQRDIFKMLDEASASTFKRTHRLELGGYGKEPMRAIVDQRVRLAFHAGTVPDDVAELVSDIAAAKGDARLAIEILHFAGSRTNSRSEEQVTPEDIRAAKAKIHSELPEHKLRELPLHELLVLLAVARKLARSGEAFAITGDVEKNYQVACEEYEETARGHTMFWQYLRNLSAYGFLDVKKSGAGQAGTTQLISLPDVPAEELKETLRGLLAEVHGKTA